MTVWQNVNEPIHFFVKNGLLKRKTYFTYKVQIFTKNLFNRVPSIFSDFMFYELLKKASC